MDNSETTKTFVFINFFRAIAALWVLLKHCMIWGGWQEIPLPGAKLAVDLFMIISGFLMAANAYSRNQYEPLTNSRNYFRFLLRRFFRLAPAYYVSLALAALASTYYLAGFQALQALNPEKWISGGVYDPARTVYSFKNILLHISFLFGLHPTYSFSSFLPDWSLSLEMQFYVVFPLLIYQMNKYGYIKYAICVGVPVFVLGQAIGRYFNYYEPSLLFIKLNYFLAGILLFRFLSVYDKQTPFERATLFFCAMLMVSMEMKYGKQLVVMPVLLAVMFLVGRMEMTQAAPVWVRRTMESKIVRTGSDASYGVYLFHGFFISAFGYILSTSDWLLQLSSAERVGVMILFITPAVYLTAYVLQIAIERPGIKLGKYLIRLIPLKQPESR